MIILDENISKSMRQQLQSWRISVRHVGFDIGREGIQDEEIVTLLHKLHHPTLFTFDSDFYKRNLCHSQYCLVHLAVAESDAAHYIRRLLKHKEFNTQAKRMGAVMRIAQHGLTIWRLHVEEELNIPWYQ